MGNVLHSEAAGIHPGAYHQSSAPSSPADGILWVDTSAGPPYQMKVWVATSSAWQQVGIVSATGHGGTVASSAILTGSNFTLTANSWTDILTLSCAAGTWLFYAQAQVVSGQGNQNLGFRIWDGSNARGSVTRFIANLGTTDAVTIFSDPVVLGSTTTIRWQGNSQTGQTPGVVQFQSVAYNQAHCTQLVGAQIS